MEHATLQSTAIHNASYEANPDNPGVGTLTIVFANGRAYQHTNVPRSIWDRLKNSSSPGRTYLDDVKGTY